MHVLRACLVWNLFLSNWLSLSVFICVCGCLNIWQRARRMTQSWSRQCMCVRLFCEAPWRTGSEWWRNALAGVLWNLASSLQRFLHAVRVNYPTTSSTQHAPFYSLDHNRAEHNHTRHHEHPVLHKKKKKEEEKKEKNPCTKTKKALQSQQHTPKQQAKSNKGERASQLLHRHAFLYHLNDGT